MNYYLICFILSALLTGIHLFRWKNEYGIHFSLMYIFATIANFGYWQIYDARDVSQAILANKIAYVGGCFSTLSLVLCIFSVCKVEINKKLKFILYALTCLVYGTSITVGYLDIFYKDVSLEFIDGKYVFIKEYAFFHTLFYVMLVTYVIISLIVLVIGFKKKEEVSFKSVRLMCIVMVINFCSFFVGRALFDVELIVASYVITEILVQSITNRIVQHNVDQLAISLMMNNGELGAAAFDFRYNYLGCNDVARKVYPRLGLLSVDKKIDKENKELEDIISWIDKMNETNSFEKIFQHEDRYYRVFGQDLYIKNKKRGYNFIFMDYTNEKEHAEELIRVATKTKGDVLARMSHEIRTPINAILGMNELILRNTKDIQSKQYAEDVKRATNNLLEIVNEILDFSKIDSGKMELQPVEYNLSNLIDDVITMFTFRAKDKNLNFIANVDESLPAFLYGDDIKIRQILANLLSNAVKYTMEGNITLEVTGDIENKKVILHFKVKDTGIGIKKENMSKLFNEFERIEEKQNRGIVGTGLGMSITIGFLKMMDSTLQVKSVYGEGSEFYFDLEQEIINYDTLAEVKDKQET